MFARPLIQSTNPEKRPRGKKLHNVHFTTSPRKCHSQLPRASKYNPTGRNNRDEGWFFFVTLCSGQQERFSVKSAKPKWEVTSPRGSGLRSLTMRPGVLWCSQRFDLCQEGHGEASCGRKREMYCIIVLDQNGAGRSMRIFWDWSEWCCFFHWNNQPVHQQSDWI